MSEYTEQTERFLTAHNLEFRAVYVGEDCPMHCEDAATGDALIPGTFPRKNHIHGSHWRLTISGKNRNHITVDFWDSYHDAEIRAQNFSKKPKPTAYDLLACLQKYEVGMFEDFCSDFGYDLDSRRAESVYQAVVKEYRMVSRFFTAEELAEIQEIN